MVFITFHHNGAEIKLRLDTISGWCSYTDGSNSIFLVSGKEVFVDENWDYFQNKLKQLQDAQQTAMREAMLSQKVVGKFNGQG